MSDSNVYTAERILAKRKHRGVTQYYIKWKGYSLKESTWEPTENIFDPSLIQAFEKGPGHKLSPSLAAVLNSSRASTNSSLHESQSSSSPSRSSSNGSRRARGRPRKSYTQQREEQVRLQKHIQQQQQQKTHLTTTKTTTTTSNQASSATVVTANTTSKSDDKPQLIVFNPQGRQAEQAVLEEIVYEPELTKEPILVTDVTSQDLTVTISECKIPDGFFRT